MRCIESDAGIVNPADSLHSAGVEFEKRPGRNRWKLLEVGRRSTTIRNRVRLLAPGPIKQGFPLQLLTFFVAVMAAQGCAIAGQPACDSSATPGRLLWNVTYSPGGTWTFALSQDADGSISGSGTSVSSGCTTGTQSTIQGTATGTGTFSVTSSESICNSGARDESIVSNITISGAGCATAAGTFTDTYFNILGEKQTLTGTVTLTDGTGVPATGETTPVFQYYEVNNPAIGDFWQNIDPTTYDFQGREVTEAFPSTFQTTCKTTALPAPVGVTIYPLVNSPNTNGPNGDGITTGYGDRVGLDVQLLDLIRRNGDAPCEIWRQQTVSIDTGTGSAVYQTNTLAMVIGFSTYYVERGNPPQLAPTRELTTPTTMKVTALNSEISTLLIQAAH